MSTFENLQYSVGDMSLSIEYENLICENAKADLSLVDADNMRIMETDDKKTRANYIHIAYTKHSLIHIGYLFEMPDKFYNLKTPIIIQKLSNICENVKSFIDNIHYEHSFDCKTNTHQISLSKPIENVHSDIRNSDYYELIKNNKKYIRMHLLRDKTAKKMYMVTEYNRPFWSKYEINLLNKYIQAL